MMPFLSLLDWQIGHTEIQTLLLISKLYQLQAAAMFPSSSLLCYLPHTTLVAEAASRSLICQILALLRPDFPLQIHSCRPLINSMDLQFLFPHSIPGFQTFACCRIWKELM